LISRASQKLEREFSLENIRRRAGAVGGGIGCQKNAVRAGRNGFYNGIGKNDDSFLWRQSIVGICIDRRTDRAVAADMLVIVQMVGNRRRSVDLREHKDDRNHKMTSIQTHVSGRGR